MTTSLTLRAADNIRLLSAAMVEKANSGHPGGPMGGADFMHILYSEYLQWDPDNMSWPLRDRFYLDAGHMSAMLYATLTLTGSYSMDDIKSFRQWGSCTPGHPELDIEHGIENTSGPLGLGHAFGIGSAIAERFLADKIGEAINHKTYIYISDGGVQEEISQGAGRIAGHLGLGNVIMFYDANDIQLSTVVDEVTTENTAKKYEAWNWHVITIDGNDHDQIRSAINDGIKETARPTLIIGKTIMGKGVRKQDGTMYEGEVELHGKPLGKSNASFEATVKGLGGNSHNPFEIFPDVQKYYHQVISRKRSQAQERQREFESWAVANPNKAKKWQSFLHKKTEHIDWKLIDQKSGAATRNASAQVLSSLADQLENMIVSSADLCNSDKTEAFLKKSSAFEKGDFSGAFLQAGVAELTMSALCTGMALHGGVIPACATFFAFSDYMKPAIRVCALMKQQVIFIWTHDAFRVGEDGPTHQPVEQEAQIRLLEKLKNHSNKNSFIALRPADSFETTTAWQVALENKECPTGLILSRQNIGTIDVADRVKQAAGLHKGAYHVIQSDDAQAVLIANGSEVATLCDAARILFDEGINVSVVSVPSEGIFRNQSLEYQREILPEGVPRFGLTAGLPVTLESMVAHQGSVWGLDHFGHSAPYTVLDEKFGFTPQNVVTQVKKLLSRK